MTSFNQRTYDRSMPSGPPYEYGKSDTCALYADCSENVVFIGSYTGAEPGGANGESNGQRLIVTNEDISPTDFSNPLPTSLHTYPSWAGQGGADPSKNYPMVLQSNRRDLSFNFFGIAQSKQFDVNDFSIGNGIEFALKTENSVGGGSRSRSWWLWQRPSSNNGEDTGEDVIQFWSNNQKTAIPNPSPGQGGGTVSTPFAIEDISGIPPSVGFGLRNYSKWHLGMATNRDWGDVSSNFCFWARDGDPTLDAENIIPGNPTGSGSWVMAPLYTPGTLRKNIKDWAGINSVMKLHATRGKAPPWGGSPNFLARYGDNQWIRTASTVSIGRDILGSEQPDGNNFLDRSSIWDLHLAQDTDAGPNVASFMVSDVSGAVTSTGSPNLDGRPGRSDFRVIPAYDVSGVGLSTYIVGNTICARLGVGTDVVPTDMGVGAGFFTETGWSDSSILKLGTIGYKDVHIGADLLQWGNLVYLNGQNFEESINLYEDIEYDVSGGFGYCRSKVCPPFDSRTIGYQYLGTGTAYSFFLETDLGGPNNRWEDIWAFNGPIATSDERSKSNITDSTLGREFISLLSPKQYTSGINGTGRTHFGLLAQQVRDVLKNNLKFPTTDDGNKIAGFAGYIYNSGRTEASITDQEKEDGTIRDMSGNIIREPWRELLKDTYGLRYSEFICPMIKAIQEVDAKWLTDQEGGTYKTSGGLAIGTTPLTGTPLSLYGGGGNLDATILRIEGKNQAMNGSGGIVNYEVNSSTAYTVTHKLNDTGYSIVHNASNRSMAFGTNKTERIIIRGTGGVLINGEPVLTSDDRIKHNEVDISNTMHIIRKLKPKQYFKTPVLYDANHNFALDSNGNPIDGSGNQVDYYVETGFIAQEVKSISELAHCVSGDESKEILGLNYNNVFVCSIAGLQEIDREQQADKVKIATLESEVSTLKTQMASVLARLAALEGSG